MGHRSSTPAHPHQHKHPGVVNLVAPEYCPVDIVLHVRDINRCCDIVATTGVQLVVTLVCGCPLIAVRYPNYDGLVA